LPDREIAGRPHESPTGGCIRFASRPVSKALKVKRRTYPRPRNMKHFGRRWNKTFAAT
jgi:hypothetical protein